MSAAITCLAPFQGLATSLDTLCAQAYGSGHKHLVGLQFQRMSCFLLTLTPPVAVLWWFAEDVLRPILPDPESAHLAGVYLKVMILAIPGIILFECGKRFTQAQGLFQATTYVLIVAAPLNVFILWLLVWHLDYGFIGAPIAVAVTENVLPVLLFLYVRFVDGSQCWGGFSRRAFSNWGVMVRLALPGMIMVEAEWLAFEIMTLLASRFGSSYLAAQSAVATLATISYQIPFPVSIAASTRIANLIGAGLSDAAKVTAKVVRPVICFYHQSPSQNLRLIYGIDLWCDRPHLDPELHPVQHSPLSPAAPLHERSRSRLHHRRDPPSRGRHADLRRPVRRGARVPAWYRQAEHRRAGKSLRLLRGVAAHLSGHGFWPGLEAARTVGRCHDWPHHVRICVPPFRKV